MSKYRITVRGENLELRGYLHAEDISWITQVLRSLARDLEPYGLVVASPTEDDYDPFTEWST